MNNNQTIKQYFENNLRHFVQDLSNEISDSHGKWSIKGFIDIYKNIYTISSDTKIISKILEIHLFPLLVQFATKYGYKIVLAEHQNYYPDISFVDIKNENIRFALDLKTTYRKTETLCNGFTLGSHGAYFTDRNGTKNIQFPYNSYLGHYCLGVIYNRTSPEKIDETKVFNLEQLNTISSVIGDFQFFVAEKWKIASDKSGSGNTANIGSIQNIQDILNGNGMFSKLGEEWFDDYWINYRKIKDSNGKLITNLLDFVMYKNGDTSLIVNKNNKGSKK
ncbi:Type-2 restriction enzyme EcoRV [Neisseria flavescens]|uniref:Restriction endonuclease EcoRV n=1 Tax=Neisseria flavescens NRL30031/H210 TaxID=546264 RepID=C0ERH2_NEIFL|nr:type II restriction endonuclease [Neisseria flavescens]EEG32370.1 restriction endonuclease EcoRV [Neisseria flavescens NRL30031/H210]SPY01356.1 Type-2 restriction enzyme EcoRV [Neisseria meningitidis]SPY06421.1 Type-2 restriction enzyme EcoRV [Neisseria meningitidis]STZ66333.1 Type-2 restriction enzyme EcoRV [Neisseria flavescens]